MAGIKFKLNFEVGRDTSLDELRTRHDAVLIATGVYKPREIEGARKWASTHRARARLPHRLQPQGSGDTVPAFDDGTLDAKGKHVAVIGGGDTAMDCVRTAMRQGAKSVSCIYRRDRENMPGSLREVANAEEEGVVFEWLTLPKAFLGKENVEGGAHCPDAAGYARCFGPQGAGGSEGRGFHARRRSGHQGVGFRSRRPAASFRRPGPLRLQMGNGAGETIEYDEQPRRRFRGGRHRARRFAGGLGDPRWARCGGLDPPNILQAKAQLAMAAE